MSTLSRPRGQATYVVSNADQQWLLTVQRKLYTRSWEDPQYTFRKLWGLVTDLRNLRCSLMRVSRNKGSRTAGVDRVTVRRILAEEPEAYLEWVREELRQRTYQPSPVRKPLIPKPGKPGKFRPLGILTVKDRIVQSALKNILEPIFEADFYPFSYGFRPCRGVHGALEHVRQLLFTQVFRTLDWYIWWVIKRWIQKKHPETPMTELYKRYGMRELWKRSVHWGDGRTDCFRFSTLKVQRFRLVSRPRSNAHGFGNLGLSRNTSFNFGKS